MSFCLFKVSGNFIRPLIAVAGFGCAVVAASYFFKKITSIPLQQYICQNISKNQEYAEAEYAGAVEEQSDPAQRVSGLSSDIICPELRPSDSENPNPRELIQRVTPTSATNSRSTESADKRMNAILNHLNISSSSEITTADLATTAAKDRGERSTAAIRIQRAWETHQRRIDKSGPMGPWLSQFHKDFIAHAIWGKNIDHVMSSGFVKPGLQILEESSGIEFEDGFYRARLKVRLPTLEKVNSDDPSIRDKFLNLYPKPDIKYVQEGDSIRLKGSVKFNMEWRSFLTDFIQKYNLPSEAFAFHLLEQFCPREMRIDSILSHHYKDLIQNKKATQFQAFSDCMQIRHMVAFPSKLNPCIFAAENCIYWHYGKIVVLRGGGKQISTPIPKKNATDTTEVVLPVPFQNEGRYFSLDLTQKDTVILGLKKDLAPFQFKPGYKCIAIEELSPRQRNFFKVPWILDPKISSISPYLSKQAHTEIETILKRETEKNAPWRLEKNDENSQV